MDVSECEIICHNLCYFDPFLMLFKNTQCIQSNLPIFAQQQSFSGMHFDFSAENGQSLEASGGARDDDLAAALVACRIEF